MTTTSAHNPERSTSMTDNATPLTYSEAALLVFCDLMEVGPPEELIGRPEPEEGGDISLEKWALKEFMASRLPDIRGSSGEMRWPNRDPYPPEYEEIARKSPRTDVRWISQEDTEISDEDLKVRPESDAKANLIITNSLMGRGPSPEWNDMELTLGPSSKRKKPQEPAEPLLDPEEKALNKSLEQMSPEELQIYIDLFWERTSPGNKPLLKDADDLSNLRWARDTYGPVAMAKIFRLVFGGKNGGRMRIGTMPSDRVERIVAKHFRPQMKWLHGIWVELLDQNDQRSVDASEFTFATEL